MDHGFIAAMIDHWGLFALGVDIALEAVGVPVPGESLLILFAGFAAHGQWSILHVMLVAWGAAVIGDNAGFWLGRRFGRPAVLRWGGKLGITEARFARVEALYARRGVWVVLTARFFVLLRQLNGYVAGATGMGWGRFFLADLVGSALWVANWSAWGYGAGAALHRLPPLSHLLPDAWFLLAALGAAGLAVWAIRRHKRAGQLDGSGEGR